jgi:hypothetical protein
MPTHESNSAKRVVALVKDGDRFEALIAPASLLAPGIHELRLLWNRRPFISRVFQRDTLEALVAWVKELQEDLMSRGWREAHPHGA